MNVYTTSSNIRIFGSSDIYDSEQVTCEKGGLPKFDIWVKMYLYF